MHACTHVTVNMQGLRVEDQTPSPRRRMRAHTSTDHPTITGSLLWVRSEKKKRKERLLGTAAEQLLGGDRLYGRRTSH